MEYVFGIDLVTLIKAIGLAGLFGIVFAESGLLIGFFLPGDSLLFTAGFLASQGFANIWVLIAGCFAAAVLGDNVGYAFGRRVGPRIFRREQSLLFNPKHLERARAFYESYGGSAIVLARFIPAIRTFAPILAGVGEMQYRSFVFYNIIGAGLWAVGMPLAGYYLGTFFPGVDRYIVPIVMLVIVLSFLPPLIAVLRDRSRRAFITAFLQRSIIAHPVYRKTIGVVLVLLGLVALALPLVPFAWVGIVGLKLLGVPLPFEQRIRAWWRHRQESP